MPKYIITESGQRLDFSDYITQLRGSCDKLRGNADQQKEFLKYRDMLFAALLYGGAEEEITEARLTAAAKAQTKKSERNQNKATLEALIKKEEELKVHYGVPGYLKKVYRYGYDYSGSETAAKNNDAFNGAVSVYDEKGRGARATFVVDAMQKILGLKDEDLVPENEEAARRFILENYHVLHLGDNIDSLIDSLGDEFDIVGQKELKNKVSSRLYYGSRKDTLKNDRQTILGALLHKQKLIRNLLVYEKKWTAQSGADRFDRKLQDSLTLYDEKPDSQYDDIEISIKNIAVTEKGIRLEKVGKYLQDSGMTLEELEELVRAKMTDRLLEEEFADKPDASDSRLAEFAKQAAARLKDEDVYREMEDYAQKISHENADASIARRYEEFANNDRVFVPKPLAMSFNQAYAEIENGADWSKTQEFFSHYASDLLLNSAVPDYQRLFAYEKFHTLIARFADEPGSHPITPGMFDTYEDLKKGLESMMQIGPALLGDQFSLEDLQKDIEFADLLVFEAVEYRKKTDEAYKEKVREQQWRNGLKEQGIDLSKLTNSYKTQYNDQYAQYSFTHGKNNHGLNVMEAFGDKPNYKEKKKSANGQAFRVELALLGCKAEVFPGKGTPFENKIRFINSMLTDPLFRKENSGFINTASGNSLMAAYDKMEANYKLTPDNSKIQDTYADLMFEAIKTADTVAMYHSKDPEKLALLSHAVQNIIDRFQKDPRLADGVTRLAETTDTDGLERVLDMSQGLVEITRIKKNALDARIRILETHSKKDLDPGCIGNFFAGKIADALLKQESAENSRLFQNGLDPVSPVLLALSVQVDEQGASHFIGEMVEQSPTVQAIKAMGYDQLRELIVKENPQGLTDKELAALPKDQRTPEYENMQKLVDRVYTEVSLMIPKKIFNDINKQVKDAEKVLGKETAPVKGSEQGLIRLN